jgi:hypothetical protein
MKLIELVEARRNPEMNGRISPLARLKELRDVHGSNLFVSFTSINKLGINPGSVFDTPLGIYAYPIDYVIEKNLRVPYAGDHPNLQVFSSNGVCWNLGVYDSQIADRVYDSVGSVLGISGKRPVANNKSVWYYMYRMIRKTKGSEKILSRQILMRAGIDWVLDPGKGIIHKNEPTQALFLRSVGLKQYDVVKQGKPTISHLLTSTELTDSDVDDVGQYLYNDKKRLTWLERRWLSGELSVKGLAVYMIGCNLGGNKSPANLPISRINEFEELLIKSGNRYEIMRLMRASVLPERWEEAEPIILQKPEYACGYLGGMVRRKKMTNWPELESIIIADQAFGLMNLYAEAVNKRVPVFEPYMVDIPNMAAKYAVFSIKGRWKEAETAIKQDKDIWKWYVNHLYAKYNISVEN